MSLQDSPISQHSASAPPKQRLNVYTMMLVMSFIAICISCFLLYFELQRFGTYPWWNTSAADLKKATSYVSDGANAPRDPACVSTLRTATYRPV